MPSHSTQEARHQARQQARHEARQQAVTGSPTAASDCSRGPLGRRGFLGLAAATLSCHRFARGAASGPPGRARLGINLAGPDDYGSELPFVDAFHLSTEWVSQREGADWGKGPQLALDERGWVKQLEPQAFAEVGLMTNLAGHVPGGTYTVLYDGEGKLRFWGSGVKAGASSPGRIQLDVQPTTDGFFVRLQETNPKNYLRNIRIIRPGFEATYKQNPWHPAFLQRWRGMAALRFMDMQRTNESKLRRWSDRPTLDSATFSARGVPIELLIDLANRQEADPWFCIPHQADDDFVHRFATLVRDRLGPRRTAWVEYSNETWNGGFGQHRYAAEQGQQKGMADDAWQAAPLFTAARSLEIFKIWEQVLGGTQRLCRVLPSMAANSEVSERIIGHAFREGGRRADVLAVAPYLSFMVANQASEETPAAQTVAGWKLDRLFEHLERKSLPECLRWMRDSRAAASDRGLRLVAYEGGQHLVGIQGAENNEAMTSLFLQANGHPRMGELYRRYLAGWAQAGGDLFCHFSSITPWSKWGSWGLLQHHDQPPGSSPKFMATMQWGRSLGQPLKVSGP